MNDPFANCTWPPLAPRYDAALRAAVAFILDRLPATGIVASGSIVRGNPDPTSDLDIVVICPGPTRQRLQRFFNDVPVEIFVNPPAAVRRAFDQEQTRGRPSLAHMLTTGWVVLALDDTVEQLRNEARARLGTPPAATPQELTWMRYGAATFFEDAVDVAERSPATANMLVNRAVDIMLQYLFRQAGQYVPRTKELLAAAAAIDPIGAGLAQQFLVTGDTTERLALAEQLADRTIGVRGFFEWTSEPEPVPPVEDAPSREPPPVNPAT